MADGKDHLHTNFIAQSVLVNDLRLISLSTFLAAALLTATICIAERLVTLTLARRWVPFRASGRWERLQIALWRTALYWTATFLRLMYMLIAMTYHMGLILVMVTTLSAGQFFIEYLELSPTSGTFEHPYLPANSEPFLSSMYSAPSQYDKTQTTPRSSLSRTRIRSKSKPTHMFIHPHDSNLARADAAAVELGLYGSTEFVAASDLPEPGLWESGKGREAARQLMGNPNQATHHRTSSQSRLFRVSDTDSDPE